eukprot:gnl/MRDRNA2_/MRDRNA2_157307_c0_seq1.p1 gnl/MRDRNA2_/MRDRNA2_157307_c0~~gnl/MRDRNA2_/MRDRNA2_157307_c0_seq1.p1  ORF type:complete len:447 (+),score=59.83 gnl/MRDRNA2_/MRDRNA2_157307_c0_seq1:113-1342(+)
MTLTVYMMIVLCLKPWKFSTCNTVDGCIKFGIAIICFTGTAYVELHPSELEVVRKQFEPIIITTFFVPLLIAVTFLAFVIWRRNLGTVYTHTERLLLAQRFRNVMAMASSMSNWEFTRLITLALPDQDRLDLLETTDVLIANVLKMQPSEKFLRRRVLPGTPYVVADNYRIGEAIRKRGLHDLPAMKDELLLQKFATELTAKRSNVKMPGSWESQVNKFRGLQDRDTFFPMLDVNGDGVISRGEFVQVAKRNDCNTLADEQIHVLFDLIDLDGSGEIRVDEICAALWVVMHDRDPKNDVQPEMVAQHAKTQGGCHKAHGERADGHLNSRGIPESGQSVAASDASSSACEAVSKSCVLSPAAALWCQWLPGGLTEGSGDALVSPWTLRVNTSPANVAPKDFFNIRSQNPN